MNSRPTWLFCFVLFFVVLLNTRFRGNTPDADKVFAEEPQGQNILLEPTTEDEAIRSFMEVKLKHSQQILAGLTSENYPAISKSAQELITLSLASTWQVHQTPTYKQDSQLFREQAKALVKSAEAKELKASTENYFKVVRSCVKCHKTVRGSKVTQFPGENWQIFGD